MKFNNDLKTTWELNGKSISIRLTNIQNSMYYESSGVIGYLVGQELHNPMKLVVYSVDGLLVSQNAPPSGYQFEYLTTHPKAEVTVVCGVIDIDNSNESWSDFYFGLDLKTGALSKIGVAR